MTPAARTAAAIQILDAILSGRRAEAALFEWGRASRFAGSGDRLAIRDLVYQALRCRRSAAWAGGSESGRGLVLGVFRQEGPPPETLFTGEGYGPAPLGPLDAGRPAGLAPAAVRLDCPDWLLLRIEAALGPSLAAQALEAGRRRGPVFLRVNASRASRDEAILALESEGITTLAHPEVACALEATGNARRISQSLSFGAGVVEMQDAHSQAVTLALGPVRGLRVLDYCAGGGGKSLHLADLGAEVTAHDVDPKRMRDLPQRAERAGHRVAIAGREMLAGAEPFPLVLVDAPCSGSGTWRRDPEGKWALTPDGLEGLTRLQDQILDEAAQLVSADGRLAFVTCSLLEEEGVRRAVAFTQRHPGWQVTHNQRFDLDGLGDGFQLAIISRIVSH